MCLLLTHGNRRAALMCCFDAISIILISSVGIVVWFKTGQQQRGATYVERISCSGEFSVHMFIRPGAAQRACLWTVGGGEKNPLRKS